MDYKKLKKEFTNTLNNIPKEDIVAWLDKNCVTFEGEGLIFEDVSYLDVISSIITCIKDKDGNTLYVGDKVSYAGKGEYIFTFFSEYGMFGLLDGDKPLGRKGSSTRYEPYILNKYHRNKIKKL